MWHGPYLDLTFALLCRRGANPGVRRGSKVVRLVPQTRHSNDESALAKCIARASHKNARDPSRHLSYLQLIASCQLAIHYRPILVQKKTRVRLLGTVKPRA
jgi:hypothetical protein